MFQHHSFHSYNIYLLVSISAKYSKSYCACLIINPNWWKIPHHRLWLYWYVSYNSSCQVQERLNFVNFDTFSIWSEVAIIDIARIGLGQTCVESIVALYRSVIIRSKWVRSKLYGTNDSDGKQWDGHVSKCNVLINGRIWYCSKVQYILLKCEAWASTFLPCHNTLALQKGLVDKGINCCIIVTNYITSDISN